LRYRAKVLICRSRAGQPPPEILAQDVRRGTDDFVALLAGVQRRCEHHHQVLNALRKFGHGTLPVGELQLVLRHQLVDPQSALP
jgi:hypothetical protein